MKVIDLLNKIANGEEIPKKIKVNEIIFEYQGDDYLYIAEDNTNNWLFSEPYSDKVEYLDIFLKTEVEIIEEDKKIEKIEYSQLSVCPDLEKLKEYVNKQNHIMRTKINEIIDYIQENK